MKKFSVIPIVLVLLLILGVGSAWSVVSLPTVNFSGNLQATAGNGVGELTLVSTVVSKVNYLDGTATTVNSVDESIIDMTVTISGAVRTGDYTFTDAVLIISDAATSFNYFSANLNNIILICGASCVLNPGLDASNPATLNMTNVVIGTDIDHPSRFIDELVSQMGTNNVLGMKMILLYLNGAIEGDAEFDIFTGLIDGVTEGGGGGVELPTSAKSIGFWKNHEEERLSVIDGAVANSDVFLSDAALTFALTKKGKKTMLQKAQQQLAALLLNTVSGLDLSTVLSAGELEIIQIINPAYDATATVADALYEIESELLYGDLLEDAKDLADELNNRDHRN